MTLLCPNCQKRIPSWRVWDGLRTKPIPFRCKHCKAELCILTDTSISFLLWVAPLFLVGALAPVLLEKISLPLYGLIGLIALFPSIYKIVQETQSARVARSERLLPKKELGR